MGMRALSVAVVVGAVVMAPACGDGVDGKINKVVVKGSEYCESFRSAKLQLALKARSDPAWRAAAMVLNREVVDAARKKAGLPEDMHPRVFERSEQVCLADAPVEAADTPLALRRIAARIRNEIQKNFKLPLSILWSSATPEVVFGGDQRSGDVVLRATAIGVGVVVTVHFEVSDGKWVRAAFGDGSAVQIEAASKISGMGVDRKRLDPVVQEEIEAALEPMGLSLTR